ncbi:MAG: ABC transporter permease [Candidatus Limiplasma sp.]|nr:ABC transporter permease [Candidatus Limiplasma sp.]MEA5145158.1 ABC transporter permease [Candidatus Limiplasma sp.]
MEHTQPKQSPLQWVKQSWKTQPLFSTAVALLVMVVLQTLALGFSYANFGEWFAAWGKNWINILRNNAGVGIIALGMTFVIISGGIDLAVGSTMVGIGAVIMVLIDGNANGLLTRIGITGAPAFLIAIAAGILVGVLLGEASGALIAHSGLPPFIATLGMMKIARSVTQQFMQGVQPAVPKDFLGIANTRIGGEIVLPILYWLLLAGVLYVVSKHTAFGRQVFAVGSSERTSKLSGVNVKKIKRRVYVLMGGLVAVASVIQIARIGSMDYANAGSGYEMDAIAAVIIGGTSMSGGRGSVLGTVLGMLILAVMNNLLNLIGVPPFLREAFKGVIVVAAVLLQKKDSAN